MGLSPVPLTSPREWFACTPWPCYYPYYYCYYYYCNNLTTLKSQIVGLESRPKEFSLHFHRDRSLDQSYTIH